MGQNKFKDLIIGAGEIGKSLQKILDCPIVDLNQFYTDSFDIIHICFPYSESFITEVREYQQVYKAKYTVIHSTVPVGTSSKCLAVHSPVIGKHPNLEVALKTFTKFLGGELASSVASYFQHKGFKVYLFDKSETTEMLKILDTTLYGLEVEFTKEVKRLCNKFEVPFEAWTVYTDNYNKGYSQLGFNNHVRPNLTPILTPIGGHCVLPNYELLETKFTPLLRELNALSELQQQPYYIEQETVFDEIGGAVGIAYKRVPRE